MQPVRDWLRSHSWGRTVVDVVAGATFGPTITYYVGMIASAIIAWWATPTNYSRLDTVFVFFSVALSMGLIWALVIAGWAGLRWLRLAGADTHSNTLQVSSLPGPPSGPGIVRDPQINAEADGRVWVEGKATNASAGARVAIYYRQYSDYQWVGEQCELVAPLEPDLLPGRQIRRELVTIHTLPGGTKRLYLGSQPNESSSNGIVPPMALVRLEFVDRNGGIQPYRFLLMHKKEINRDALAFLWEGDMKQIGAWSTRTSKDDPA